MDKLRFDFERGIIYKFIKKYNTYEKAKCIRPDGYLYIGVGGKRIPGHRLLFEQFHNIQLQPGQFIDHINNIRSDNRVSNLRIATYQQNNQNKVRQSNNTSGHVGVHFFKNAKRWEAYYWKNSKKFHLGYFKTIEEAVEARKTAIEEQNNRHGCYFK